MKRLIAAVASAGALILPATALAFAKPAPSQTPSAERPILLIAQLRCSQFDRALAPELEPLTEMKDVEAVLKAHDVACARGHMQLDTRTAQKALLDAIAKLPPGEIFAIPLEDGLTVNQVLRALTPEDAERMENW